MAKGEVKRRILEIIARKPYSFMELCREGNIPQSSAAKFLNEFLQTNLVVKDDQGRYVLTNQGRELVKIEAAKKAVVEDLNDVQNWLRTQQGKWVWLPIGHHKRLKDLSEESNVSMWAIAAAAFDHMSANPNLRELLIEEAQALQAEVKKGLVGESAPL